VSGSDRLKNSIRKLGALGVGRYNEAPATASEAETRAAVDALAAQVRLNRRLLIAVGLAVVINDTSLLVEIGRGVFGGL
jgi:hypothetical protein